jgi:hypothetical protein
MSTPSVEPATAAAPPPAPGGRRGWTAGRIVSLVLGCIVGLISLGFLAAGGWTTWATTAQREGGYITADTHTLATPGYAVTSDEIGEIDNQIPERVLGTVRIRATPTSPSGDVFIGIAPAAAVDRYLTGVDRQVITGWLPFDTDYVRVAGAAPKAAPTDVRIWTAQASGSGTQTLKWRPANGNWTVVVMHTNGTAQVSATADIGATFPDLGWVAFGLLATGVVLLGAAVTLIALAAARASR